MVKVNGGIHRFSLERRNYKVNFLVRRVIEALI